MGKMRKKLKKKKARTSLQIAKNRAAGSIQLGCRCVSSSGFWFRRFLWKKAFLFMSVGFKGMARFRFRFLKTVPTVPVPFSGSWKTARFQRFRFPVELPSDRTKPTFKKKGKRPRGMSTLTETSYLVAQLRPSRERKQKRRTKGGREKAE